MIPEKNPLALIAELTHRCPLRCVYCSNPEAMRDPGSELPTADWVRIFGEAAGLGIVQLHLTGGEPLARPDLAELIGAARGAGLYTNLITSGIGLGARRLDELVAAGLDHAQLSMQDSDPATADRIAGVTAFAKKIEVARLLRKRPVAFTLNVVVHRHNLDRLEAILAMAEGTGASRLEIAHVQYNGWAFRNRERLLPTREQVDRSIQIVEAARKRLEGRMRIDFVVPDYYAKYPKACMGGWARAVILIDPAGDAWPCHSASVIPGLEAPSVRRSRLEWIWRESPAFRRFRGEQWMAEPCRSCSRREIDFGGCRCQAMLVTGDPAATDPVCRLSADRGRIDAVLERIAGSASDDWIYRPSPKSRRR